MQSVATMLRTVPGFARLDEGALERVAAEAAVAEARAGEVLFREGATPERLYVLLDGQVSLTGTAAGRSSTVIDILGPRSSFVLASVLADEPYLMGAQAITGSLLVQIPAAPMRAAVAARPAAAMAMIDAMAAELGRMTRQVVDLKVRVAAQRLGTYLLSLVTDPDAAVAAFRLPIRKRLLAPLLGCRAENLSRAFAALRAYGVETHGSHVLLREVSRLRSYAGTAAPAEQAFSDAFELRSWAARRNSSRQVQ